MSFKRRCFSTVITLFLGFTTQAQRHYLAENDTLTVEALEEVMVTATRTIRQLSSLPLPAQIISKSDIENSNTTKLNELLSEQTGLLTVPDYGGGEGIQMQGMDAQYTLILIDGMPLVGRSAGTLDLSRVSVGNVRQVEIVKGASSSLYGSDALGGVINILTAVPKDGFQGRIQHRMGTFHTHDTGATLQYQQGKIGLTAFINRYSSDGYDLRDHEILNTVDPYKNHTVSNKLAYAINKKTSLLLSGRYFTQEQDYIATEELQGESNIREWNAQLALSHTFNSAWRSKFELYATRYRASEYLDDTDGSRFSEGYYNQLLVRPELRLHYNPSPEHSFTGGVGVNHKTLDRTYFSVQPVFNAPYIYLQYDANPHDKINLILGARFDSHNKYQSKFSPKAAIRYELTDDLAIKGSVGVGFKAPDFRQLYFDFTNATVGYTVLGYNAVETVIPTMDATGQLSNILVPVSDFAGGLKPESSVSVNFGVHYQPSPTLSLDANLFRNHITDLIDTQVIANKTNGQNVFSYYNVDQVYTQGLELNLGWKPTNQVKVSGGYQLLYAKDRAAEKAFENGTVFARENPGSPAFQLTEKDYTGLYNRSKHMLNIKAFVSIPNWNANANIRATYRSKYGLYDSNTNSYLDAYDDFVKGYAVWDLAFNKTYCKKYQLGIGVDNLFDYTDTKNINNLPGCLVYGKINIQF